MGDGIGVAEFWAEWGMLAYAGAAGWAFFEGETFVLLAAAAGRATDLIDPWMLTFCVWIGSFLGDQLWFTLGRRYGARAVRRLPGAERRLAQAISFLDRYGVAFVLTFRFAYGIRNVASAACGVAGMNWARFAVLNFIAAGIWATSFVSAGWYLAAWLGAEGVYWLLGAVGFAIIGSLVLRMWRGTARTASTKPAV
ncbi:DedA family protein [Limobrevibacterium gyesilva]|uniref:DedA family protein n=1 Tax=Limobrevibacterium gyesilva TaxID=2991712 RepID=A0AA42CED5_9PROT|nr:DedA family protein [Limobrevibacterium gyesilva]MCW3475144.1 DedA family protein [Limobrevibacterium gyesilva]